MAAWQRIFEREGFRQGRIRIALCVQPDPRQHVVLLKGWGAGAGDGAQNTSTTKHQSQTCESTAVVRGAGCGTRSDPAVGKPRVSPLTNGWYYCGKSALSCSQSSNNHGRGLSRNSAHTVYGTRHKGYDGGNTGDHRK